MMLMLVFLLSSIPAFMACLQCDRRIRLLHEDFILSAPNVNDQIEMKKICDHAYVTYKETSWQRKGVIGESKTQYSARCHSVSFRSQRFLVRSGNEIFYYKGAHLVLDIIYEMPTMQSFKSNNKKKSCLFPIAQIPQLCTEPELSTRVSLTAS